MVWHSQYRHECPETGEVVWESEIRGSDTPVCEHCGQKYQVAQE